MDTAKRVKVADIAWVSEKILEKNREQTPYLEAPEVCIEIKLPSNSDEEMLEKKEPYFVKAQKNTGFVMRLET